jgi:hypothetical protein
MRHRISLASAIVLTVSTLLGASPGLSAAQDASPPATLPAGVTVVASGLTNPRGFAWGPDGVLYLALAGLGGETEGTWQGGPSGSFGGPTSSIVRIENGCPVVVVSGLSSSNFRPLGEVWGVVDVAFLGDQLYYLQSAGGEDYGNPNEPSGVYRIEADGSTTLVANLSCWLGDVPPAFVAGDYNSDGSLFDLEAGTDRLWLTDAVGGRLLTVTPEGQIALIADLSDGHLVPTGVALAPDGGAYVGYLTAHPYTDGSAKVVHVAADGTVTDYWTGLTTVTDIALGPDGVLYAAEMSTGNLDAEPFVTPDSGRVVRRTGPDTLEEVLTDVAYPVMLGYDAAGALYVTYPAFGEDAGAGLGAIIGADLSVGTPISLAGLELPAPSC